MNKKIKKLERIKNFQAFLHKFYKINKKTVVLKNANSIYVGFYCICAIIKV